MVIPVQLILISLFILGISVLVGLFLKRNPIVDGVTESFENVADSDLLLQACPSGMQMFTTEGKTFCCDGDIVGGECNGHVVCSLSSDTPTLPSCVNRLRADFKSKSERFCPPSIPHYFEGAKRGCTAGLRTADGKAPISGAGIKTCTIYNSDLMNRINIDSCLNIRKQDTTLCPQGDKPSLVSLRAGAPIVLQCPVHATGDPYPHTCYVDSTFTDYLNSSKSDWKNMSFNESLMFCSKAIDHYISKTLIDPNAKTSK